jgi:DNA modification methylase
MNWSILEGDCLDVLPTLPDKSVHCVVTSPPYFGLRNYGVEGQIGLEPTPAEFVAAMLRVFGAVKRVLRDDGTLWLNLGDSYARSPSRGVKFQAGTSTYLENRQATEGNRGPEIPPGLKEKDLMMMPARVAIALQDDGWYLRSDIIWAKKAPMPESVTDRPTSAHEHIFLLTKRANYYYDADAVREPQTSNGDGQHFRNSPRYIDQTLGVSNDNHVGDIGAANGYTPLDAIRGPTGYSAQNPTPPPTSPPFPLRYHAALSWLALRSTAAALLVVRPGGEWLRRGRKRMALSEVNTPLHGGLFKDRREARMAGLAPVTITQLAGNLPANAPTTQTWCPVRCLTLSVGLARQLWSLTGWVGVVSGLNSAPTTAR